MTKDKDWKNFLLNSGLPLEYEVKECFFKHGCTVWDEYSYIKEDENKFEKEFSYDIDANYWGNGFSIDFLIECKYKSSPTKWIFTPDLYSYQLDLNRNAFFHSLDHFTDNKFLFNTPPYDEVLEKLGPFCLKGTEIYMDKSIETNIHKAINQLSYAFVEKIIIGYENQISIDALENTIFCYVPIIITNADLYLLNNK